MYSLFSIQALCGPHKEVIVTLKQKHNTQFVYQTLQQRTVSDMTHNYCLFQLLGGHINDYSVPLKAPLIGTTVNLPLSLWHSPSDSHELSTLEHTSSCTALLN